MIIPVAAGRREANKARTREAVVEAATALLQTQGLDSLTAEQVADAAGISRRTFFNYFPSVEAVFAYKAQEVLDALRTALASRPLGEPLVDGANAVVDEMFTATELDDAVRTWLIIDSSPAATRYALEATSESVVALGEQWAKERLQAAAPGTTALRVSVLTTAFIAAFDTARLDWLRRHTPPIDERARAEFVRTVGEAFEYLRPAVECPHLPT